jgi:hypothetical protein
MTTLNFTSPEPSMPKTASSQADFSANNSRIYERMQGSERGARKMAWVALPVAVVAIGAIVYATTPRNTGMVTVPPVAANTASAPVMNHAVANPPAVQAPMVAQTDDADRSFSASTAAPPVHKTAAPAHMARAETRTAAPRREPVARSASAGAATIVPAPAPVVTTPPAAAVAPPPVIAAPAPAPVEAAPQPSAAPPADNSAPAPATAPAQ